MKIGFELTAEFRDDQGKGSSRRLRRTGRVPAILYGGKRDPRGLSLPHEKLMTLVENEKFYSSIINLKVGDVIPFDFDGRAVLKADGAPLFRGRLGASRGLCAIQLEGNARASRMQGPSPLAQLQARSKTAS